MSAASFLDVGNHPFHCSICAESGFSCRKGRCVYIRPIRIKRQLKECLGEDLELVGKNNTKTAIDFNQTMSIKTVLCLCSIMPTHMYSKNRQFSELAKHVHNTLRSMETFGIEILFKQRNETTTSSTPYNPVVLSVFFR